MNHPSTTASTPTEQPPAPVALRWRSWPLVDHARWSWVVPVGILAIGSAAVYFGGWLPGAVAIGALVASLWQFFTPVEFELDSLGLRRRALGRSQLMPWHFVRAYQARATGIVLFQRPDATAIDALRSDFLPYGVDEDETLCAVRHYLSHAEELAG